MVEGYRYVGETIKMLVTGIFYIDVSRSSKNSVLSCPVDQYLGRLAV